MELQAKMQEVQRTKAASSPGSAAGRKSRAAKSEPEREGSNFSRNLSAFMDQEDNRKAAVASAAFYINRWPLVFLPGAY